MKATARACASAALAALAVIFLAQAHHIQVLAAPVPDASSEQTCAALNAVKSGATHCMCLPSYPLCTGQLCVKGKKKATGEIVTGFLSSCSDCSCNKVQDITWDDDDARGSNSHGKPARAMDQHEEEIEETKALREAYNVLHDPYYAARIANQSDIDYSTIAARLGGDTTRDMRDVAYWDDLSVKDPRVLIMTVATHREPFIELTEKSVAKIGQKLLVAGEGEFFKGYGWKLKRVRRTLLELQNDYDIVLFTDSFDSFVFGDIPEIVSRFRSLQSPMVVSGEVNCWPNPHLAPFMPKSSETGHYKYPNSGGYVGYLGYILHLYNDVIAIHHKSDCCDDQGELIKAVVRDNRAFRIDHNADFFQTLFGSAKKDVTVVGSRIHNTATGTTPVVVHANGWDKKPLLDIVIAANHATAEDFEDGLRELEKKKILQDRESQVNKRCENYDPNPSLDPEKNYITEYGLTELADIRRKQLQTEGVSWDQIEQQVFEVQEYRTFCPALNNNAYLQARDQARNCKVFKVYVYPLPSEEEKKLPLIYRYVRAVIKNSIYNTNDPSKACLFIPATDVSCWCEACLQGTYQGKIQQPHENSLVVAADMAKEAYWHNDGRNHVIFEFSDAPCLPFQPKNAIVAKAGLSSFHFRAGFDVSMPLFSMVTYTDEQRRVPASKRKYLVTFRGTKSDRSDAVRKHLPKIHNSEDVILVCACRWYGHSQFEPSNFDQSCKDAETEFNKYTYTELSLNTKFGLIVEGFGYHSFRLTEILAAGAIPVIAVDHYVLPFSDLLDWETFSIRIPEHRLMELPSILRKLPMSVVETMQQRAIFAFERFFRSLPYQLHTALESIRINQFSGEEKEFRKKKTQIEGLPYDLPEEFSETAPSIIKESLFCNTPPHRRKESKDNAPM